MEAKIGRFDGFNSEARKRIEGEAKKLPNPNDEKKPFVNQIMVERTQRRMVMGK